MQLERFMDYYAKRKFDQENILKGVDALRRAEATLIQQNTDLDHASIPQIQMILNEWIQDQTNDLDSILALARYYTITSNHELYVYFTRITGGLGVIETIKERFDEVMAPDLAKDHLSLKLPPLGTDPQDVPSFIDQFMKQLEAVSTPHQTQHILCGNNHQLDKAAFLKEKEIYESSASLDDYLKGLHDRKVNELQAYCDQNKVWFEQKITQATVDFVASNPELLSATHHDGILYLTKIPYDPDAYLKETDPIKKRYLTCHCPFAREAILKGEPKISKNWCHCSAGFEKFHFETIMDKTLEVDVLESVLNGDDRCRFAIHLK